MNRLLIIIFCFLATSPFAQGNEAPAAPLPALPAITPSSGELQNLATVGVETGTQAAPPSASLAPAAPPATPEAAVITPPSADSTVNKAVNGGKASIGDVAKDMKDSVGGSKESKTEVLTFTESDGQSSQITKNMPDIFLAPRLSQIIPLESAAAQVLVTDPKIADVQLPNAHTLYVYGRTTGTADIIVTSAAAKTSYRYKVKVKADFNDMSNIIQSMIPTKSVVATPIPEGVLLQGSVSKPSEAEDIRLLAKQYVGQGTVINQLKIKGSSQVNLRVKIAEVQRTVVNSLGINWSGLVNRQSFKVGLLTGRGTGGLDSSGNFVQAAQTPNPLNSLGVRLKTGLNDFTSMVDALAQEQLATILAEPNLVATSGEEASFLVGGEFPYPVAQGTGTGVTVTYQFKQYGINLAFLPIVLDDKIVMRIRTEVSDLDFTQSVQSAGSYIPAIRTRRAESTLEMGSGQSMVLAGLLSDDSSAGINALPGLGDIPILGALFRSNNFQSKQTELVILVTPYTVDPLESPQDASLPTDGIAYANLADQFLFRRMTKPQAPHAPESPHQPPHMHGESGFSF